MMGSQWYIELFVDFDDEDVTQAIAEDHVTQAILRCGDVLECEVTAIEEWCGDDDGVHLRDEGEDSVTILNATRPKLQIVESVVSKHDPAAMTKMMEDMANAKIRAAKPLIVEINEQEQDYHDPKECPMCAQPVTGAYCSDCGWEEE
jgi:hypothetical protein